MLVKTEAFKRIGLLDEGLAPMYGEDVEYSFRVWKNGYKVIYAGHTCVIHHESYTIDKFKETLQKKKLYCSIRNSIIISKTYFGLLRTLLFGLPILLIAALLDKKDKSAGVNLKNLRLKKGPFANILLALKAIRSGIKTG